jgi:hypothetical protein
MSQKPNSAIAVIGIDIGKNAFHLVGQDKRGAIVLRQKWSRGQVEARLANVQRCLIGMEACVGAQSQAAGAWSRRSADAGEIRAPVFQRSKERLSRCGGDCRGGATPDDEIRRHQDRRAKLDLQESRAAPPRPPDFPHWP